MEGPVPCFQWKTQNRTETIHLRRDRRSRCCRTRCQVQFGLDRCKRAEQICSWKPTTAATGSGRQHPRPPRDDLRRPSLPLSSLSCSEWSASWLAWLAWLCDVAQTLANPPTQPYSNTPLATQGTSQPTTYPRPITPPPNILYTQPALSFAFASVNLPFRKLADRHCFPFMPAAV